MLFNAGPIIPHVAPFWKIEVGSTIGQGTVIRWVPVFQVGMLVTKLKKDPVNTDVVLTPEPS